ncbi:MAG: HPP family protein [Dehalococcoidales bacterium]|nr:HPP family protein [Dehalococcoidales bacterium]
MTHTAIVVALAASTFIVFSKPSAKAATPRRLIGGYLVGIICGLLCYYIFNGGLLHEAAARYDIVFWFACALSVALSLFLMTITNTEHAPAAAIAMGIVASGFSWQVVIFVVLFAVLLSLARRLLKPWLRDLIN